MFRHRVRTPTPPFDEAAAERLLGGAPVDDLPDDIHPLGRLLAAASGPATPDELDGSAAAAAAFVAAHHAANRTLPRRTRSMVASVLTALAVVASTGTAVAATQGALPEPVQQIAHEALGVVGIHVPGITSGDDDAGDDVSVSTAPSTTFDTTTTTTSGAASGAVVPSDTGAASGTPTGTGNGNGTGEAPDAPSGQTTTTGPGNSGQGNAGQGNAGDGNSGQGAGPGNSPGTPPAGDETGGNLPAPSHGRAPGPPSEPPGPAEEPLAELSRAESG